MVPPSRQAVPVTVPQLAARLGVSRVTIYHRVVRGSIPAEKPGRDYIISAQTAHRLTRERHARISAGVHRVVSEYGSVLERLGRE
jgi:excisionase family DNA binding protein